MGSITTEPTAVYLAHTQMDHGLIVYGLSNAIGTVIFRLSCLVTVTLSTYERAQYERASFVLSYIKFTYRRSGLTLFIAFVT